MRSSVAKSKTTVVSDKEKTTENQKFKTKDKSPSAEYKSELHIMLAPYLIGMLILVIVPTLITVWLSFTHYNVIHPPTWNGLNNYSALQHDRDFKLTLLNSLIFVGAAVPLRIMGALALAMLLKKWRRGVGFYRISVFLPTIIPDVAYALIWLWILNPVYGPLNRILESFGLEGPAWMSNARSAMAGLILMSLFTIGEGFIVFLAGLQAIPQDYYESASVDGASHFGKFRHITFPLLKPWLVLMVIRDIIVSTQNTFVPGLIMTKLGKPYTNIDPVLPDFITGGKPYYSTRFVPHWVYEEAYDFFKFGYASAMMVIVYLVIAVLLAIVYFTVRGWGYQDDN